VRVQGNRFFDEKNVRAGLPSLKEGTSPNTRAIGQDAQLVNENPAKQVSVALQAADDPGQVDATVRVTDEKPGRISVFADNTGTPATGNLRTGLGYQNANLFNGDDVLSAQAITSPGHASDVKVFGAGYHVPVYGWGGVVDMLAGYSSVNSGAVLENFTVSGKGTVFGLRYTQMLGRIDAYEHRVALGLDYRAYKNSVIFGNTGDSQVPDITVRPISLTYLGRFSQVGRDLSFNVSYSQNIPGGKNGDQDTFGTGTFDSNGTQVVFPARAEARASYAIWRAGVSYSQVLPSDFILRAVANAQQTHDLLIPGEQFGMGGADSVRGYYERETASDVGRRFSLEGYGPDFGSWIGNNWRARALVFADTARGHDNRGDPALAPERTPGWIKLGSFGLGLRANQGKTLAFRLDVARVTEAAGTRLKGDYRAHAAVAYSF
jgi:hemolysin activation/secretion protein